MGNSLEKINKEMGAKLRGEYGIRRGNEIIRSMAEVKDGCKYPLWELKLNLKYYGYEK